MKQRITGLDLQILVSEFQENLVNYRLQNIYNVLNASRSFILKFSVPDSKKSLVLDCGNKAYLTNFDRETTQTPSNFVTKLRKHLKSRRLSSIKQVNNDRILVLEFSDGAFYLCLEFFSAGNIILLDNERRIMAVQRVVAEKSESINYSINAVYGLFDSTLFSSTYTYNRKSYTAPVVEEWVKEYKTRLDSMTTSKAKKVYSIHKLLFVNNSHLSSDLITKHLTTDGFSPSKSCLEYTDDPDKFQKLADTLTKAEDEYVDLVSTNKLKKGVIVMKRNKFHNKEDSRDDLEYVYEQFHPFMPVVKNDDDFKCETISGYNNTLDTFFSTLESTRYALKIEQQKQKADKRLEAARNDKIRQIEGLEEVEKLNSKKGDLIILHADLVESCRSMVQNLLDKQMDWSNIESLINSEKLRNNKIANSIRLPLNLKENKINVILPEEYDSYLNNALDKSSDSSSSDSDSTVSFSDFSDDSSDDELTKTKKEIKRQKSLRKDTKPTVSAWIDLGLSAFANARTYFDSKKQAESKKGKVEKSTEIALKNAEKKITKDLERSLKVESETLKQIRPKFWFEKFFWFVSSEGYLCLAGRDPSQDDLIYYRHFNDNDVLVSSDVERSIKVFIKNPYKGEVLPPSTLMQAGIFSLSSSKAWDSKITTSAWLIRGSDVSKRDFDGHLLSSGSFYYKSKVEYLPPCQVVMGFGFYWLADETTSEKYKKMRLERQDNMNATIVMDNRKKDIDHLLKSESEVKEKSDLLSEMTSIDALEEESDETDINESDNKQADGPLDEPSDENSTSSELTVSVQKQAPLSRGKRSKLKKIAAKYADQDEEERKLRMQALGTLKQVEKLEEEKQKSEEKQTPHFKKVPKAAQRNIAQEKRELAKYMNEDPSANEASISNYLEILDSFVAAPRPNDHYSEPIPVFGPWASFNKHKYKVKVQPGNGKKGKSVTEMLHYFTSRKMDPSAQDTDLDWPQEREHLKTLKNDVLVSTMTVNKLKAVIPISSSSKSNGKKTGVKPKRK